MDERSAMVVDPDRFFSTALTALLAEDGVEVRGAYPCLQQALSALAVGAPAGTIIIDPITACGTTGLDAHAALQHLRQAAPDARIVVVTGALGEAAMSASLAAGATAHLSKGGSTDALRRALRLAQMGQCVYPADAIGLLENEGESRPRGGNGRELSRREAQILACLLTGLSNKAIARRLEITESTVKMHFKNTLRKIGAHNRTQAAVWALDHGVRPLA